MKVAEDTVLFHTSGVSGKFDYEVASTAKMMNMLSNSLYKDKITAVLRELGTNARDSHIMAGQTRPFDVVLPTRTKLELRIRDYGTGMSPEKLEKMYRVYGASDKTESNDFNGCMGIGSKSPFSYSTSFTSISYHNGKKYTYINAKDERGIPSLNRLGVEDTTEPNGLEIVVAVKQADVDEFLTKAKRVYRPFPAAERPNVTVGGSKVAIETHIYKMQGNNWAFRGAGDNWGNNSNSFIVMGCVEYPIDIQHFVNIATNQHSPAWYNNGGTGTDTDYSRLIRMGLNLFCNIGDVEMDISREGLQYTKSTIEHIKKLLDVALLEIKTEVSKRFTNCKTRWDARVLYRDLIRGDLRNLQQVIELTKPEWNGKEIGKDVGFDSQKFPDTDIVAFSGRGNDRAYKNTNVYSIEALANVKFIENDLDKGAHAACTRLCNESGVNTVYLMTFKTTAARQQFIDHLGIDPALLGLASALPKPPKKVRGPVEKVFKYQSAQGRNYASRNYWEAVDLDIEDGGFFVEISAWRPVVVGTDAAGNPTTEEKSGDCISTIIETFKTLGIKMPTAEVIGVKTIGVKKFRKRTDIWTDFFDWAKKELDKHLIQSKLSDDVALVNEVDSISSQTDKFLLISKVSNPDAKVGSLFYKFTTALSDATGKKKNMQSKITAALTASATLGLKFDASAKQDSLDKQLGLVTKKYPMLDLVERWHLGSKPASIKHIADYINLVDTCCP